MLLLAWPTDPCIMKLLLQYFALEAEICSPVNELTETLHLALQLQITYRAHSVPSFFSILQKTPYNKFYFYRECCTPQQCSSSSYFSISNGSNWKLLNAKSSYINKCLNIFLSFFLAPIASRYTVTCSGFRYLCLLNSSIFSLWIVF